MMECILCQSLAALTNLPADTGDSQAALSIEKLTTKFAYWDLFVFTYVYKKALNVVHFSFHLIYLCIYQYICPSIYLSIYLYIYLSNYLSIYLFICLSIYLSIYLALLITPSALNIKNRTTV